MRLSQVAASAAANAVTALLNNGYCRFYTAPRPATPETALTTQALLASPRFGTTAFNSAVNGVAVATPMVDEDSTPNGGIVTWFRLFKADGSSVVADGSVGLGDLDINTNDGFDIEIGDTTIDAGRRLGITVLRYTHPVGT